VIIKKFQAETETEAIMLAKEELGKDAIVLNIKTITPKGIYKLFRKSKVEITAAIDESNGIHSSGNSSTGMNLNITSTIKSGSGTSIGSVTTAGNALNQEAIAKTTIPGIIYENEEKVSDYTSAIEHKLNNLQNLLEKELIEKRDSTTSSPKVEEDDKSMSLVQLVYNQLLRNEVDEKYINQIIGEIDNKLKKDITLDSLLSSVYQKIVLKLGQPRTIELEEGKTKFVYFIGPTGVGKTTTIAKIASSLKLNKKAKVALLTSDTYRIAAVEQLRTYANILSVPMKVVYTEEDMKEAKLEFNDYDVVLIDTAGRSHRSSEQKDNISFLVNSIEEEFREIYLVLSATTKYRDLIEITERYAEITNFRLIFTKLDETCCVGNIFNIRMLTGADLSYTTNGQNVPEDIDKIDAQQTAKKLLGGNE
jgi:flagellar biosynthesis protein FlhF